MKIKNITNNELMSVFGGTICTCFMEDMHIDKKIKMINIANSNEEEGEKECVKKCCSEAKYLEYKFALKRTMLCPREMRMHQEQRQRAMLVITPIGVFLL